jgi:LacI family transcriptional regulator
LRGWRQIVHGGGVKRKRILIVVGFLNPSILAGFTRYAREADWVVNAISVYHHAVPTDWEADGMLTTNVFRQDLARFIRKTAQKIPTVLHGCDDLQLGVANVECDEYEIGRIAARHLLDQEHRHFAYFRYSNNIHALRRRAGFEEVLQQAGHDYLDLEIISEHGEGIEKRLKAILPRLPKPLGLFAEDDLLAAQVIETAVDVGWQVPGDLAVVGCGNIELVCEFGSVPITSIGCPIEEQAYRAAAMLDSVMMRKKNAQQHIVLPPMELVARESTNAVAAHLEIVKRALDCMKNRMSETTLDARKIADDCGVSLRLLYREFDKDLRSTPMECLLKMRVRESKELLAKSDKKIEDIAELCGFGSLRSFQRAFQRKQGMPPTRWRKQQRENG